MRPRARRRRGRKHAAFLVAFAAILGIVVPSHRGAHGEPPCRHLAIIVHKTNPTSAISLRELADIYLGLERRWPGGAAIMVVAPAVDSDLDQTFRQQVLVGRRGGRQAGSPLPFRPLRTSGVQVPGYVELFPRAIGCMWSDTVPDTVKQLRIDGLVRANVSDCTEQAPRSLDGSP